MRKKQLFGADSCPSFNHDTLTEDSEPEVECDDDDLGVGGEDAAVVEVARAPGVALAVDEDHHRVAVLVELPPVLGRFWRNKYRCYLSI